MFPDIAYDSGRLRLADSDLIVIYSDGLSEAQSKDEIEFGDARISGLIEAHRDSPLVDIQTRILEAVAEWSDGESNDDMTIVLVRVNKEYPREEKEE
jgi:sigma-B regulation protein RsbU (phosphoserine phosphatase)